EKYEDAYAFTRKEVEELKGKGEENEIFETIIKKYKYLENNYDFILVEGTDFFNEVNSFEFDLNREIAQNLNIPVILVLNSKRYKTEDSLIKNTSLEIESYTEKNIKVISVIANKFKGDKDKFIHEIKQKHPDYLVSTLPIEPILSKPTVGEVAQELNAKILMGSTHLSTIMGKSIVGAMQMRNFLERLSENCLVITPGDRADLIVGTMLANISANYTKVAGIVLTGDYYPEESVVRLIEGIHPHLPVMIVKTGTFETANKVGSNKSKIYPTSTAKIKIALELFDKNVDTDELDAIITNYQSTQITPRMFQYNMMEQAYKIQKRIVLPEGTDDRILRAASMLAEDKVVYLTILGEEKKIKSQVNLLGLYWDEERIKIINPSTSSYLDDFSETLYHLRKEKGMQLAQARDLMHDVSYFGTMMVYKGLADGMVSGAINTTQHTIRTSGQGEEVEKVRLATEKVKQQRPDLLIEGPIQYDAAVDPKVGKQKLPDSEVAGQANVLIFPDLNTGNNTYKAVQRETGALAIGPVLQGLNKPVNDLSRGATVDDIYNT
ncbi:unnamed protein product, partial [Darwinula stevensoni]